MKEDWMLCPWNRGHRVPSASFAISHNCKDSKEPNRPEYENCSFHRSHTIVKGKLHKHHEKCSSKEDLQKMGLTNVPDLEVQKFLRNKGIPSTNEKPETTSHFLTSILNNPTEEKKEDVEDQQNELNSDPKKNTICWGCDSPITYIVTHCNVCFLVHPQKFTEETRSLLDIGKLNNKIPDRGKPYSRTNSQKGKNQNPRSYNDKRTKSPQIKPRHKEEAEVLFEDLVD